MLQKRRTVPMRRTLKLEALEDRTLLTGNVTAVLNNLGLLTITGDFASNQVQILDSSPPSFPNLSFRVQGRPGSFTAVNGVGFIDFVGTSIQSISASFIQNTTGGFGASRLDVIGLPALPLVGNTILNLLQVRGGTGAGLTVNVNDLRLNQADIQNGGTNQPSNISMTRVTAGQTLIVTGNSQDTVSLLSCNMGTAQITTNNTNGGTGANAIDANNNNQNNGDNVVVNNTASGASTIGNLTITSGVGTNNITVANTSAARISVTNTGTRNRPTISNNAQRLSSVVNVSGNTVLTSITVVTGDRAVNTVQPTNAADDNNSGAFTVTRQRVTVDNNTITQGTANANVIDVTVGSGEVALFRDGNGNNNSLSDINTMSVSGNRLNANGAISAVAGDNLLTGVVSNNLVSRTGAFQSGVNVRIGDGSGYGSGGVGFAASSVTVSGNNTPLGLLNVSVGQANSAAPPANGIFTQSLIMNGNTSRFLNIGQGSTGANTRAVATPSFTATSSNNSPGSTTLTNNTVTGTFNSPNHPLIGPSSSFPGIAITIGYNVLLPNSAGTTHDVTINGLNAPFEHVAFAVGNRVGFNTGSTLVNVQTVTVDTFDGPSPQGTTSIIGNGFAAITFNNITTNDTDGDFSANLEVTIGTNLGGGTSTITFSNLNIAGDLTIVKGGVVDAFDINNWFLFQISAANFTWNADGSGNSTNIAALNFDAGFNPLNTTIKIGGSMSITFGTGFNGVAVHNLTSFFGFINGGSGGGSVLQGYGDFSNFGWNAFGFQGYF